MTHLRFNRPVSQVALSLVVLASTTLPAFSAIFQDTQYNWAGSAIQQLSDQNIIGGYPDGTFKPDGKINRAEFSTVLVKALGVPFVSASQASFQDVPSNYWAFPAIETVKSQGLVSGYPGGHFEPGKNISRAEAIAVLVSAAHLPVPDDAGASQILAGYSDQNLIPAWARRSVAAAIQNGLYANDPSAGNFLQPIQPATRAQVAAMVSNLREKMNMAHAGSGYGNTASNTGANMNMPPSNGTLQGYVTAVPADTKFAGTLSNAISSELNRVGDTVEMTLDRSLVNTDGTQVIVPQGSKIVGKIVTVEPAGRLGKPATLDINFNEIVTPDGRHFQISAKIDTEDGLLHGDTTKGRVLKAAGETAIGAGLGAALGTAMGPLSGGSVGRGAIYGTALGAGAGAIAAAAQKGKAVVVTTGDKINVKLTQPLTVGYQQ